MDFIDFTAGPNDNDRRIDKIIRIFIKDLPLSQIYKSIRKGFIKVNNKKTTQEYHVVEGDIINIAEFLVHQNSEKRSSVQNKTESQSIGKLPEIVFKNQSLVIFNKYQGINVQGKDSLEEIVTQYYSSTEKNNSLSFKPGPLHRLDKYTTGLIAFSWDIEGARWFSQNIKDHSITKKYLGIVQGKITSELLWEDEIAKTDEEETGKFHTVKVNSSDKDALNANKKAVTKVIPICTGNYKKTDISLVFFDISTGRQHQIRSQSSYHGYPLIGDSAYNGSDFNKELKTFFLHAYELRFPENPVGLPDKITAPLPKEFSAFLSKTCDMKNIVL